MSKTALITGVTGQDGTYLARQLLELGYRVYGVVRRASLPNTARIDSLLARAQTGEIPFTLMSGDMTDSGGLHRILEKTEPDEVYNLAAQ